MQQKTMPHFERRPHSDEAVPGRHMPTLAGDSPRVIALLGGESR
jgi:hypothetical protein